MKWIEKPCDPWRVSWNDPSFELSFLPGPWSHWKFGVFFWHPKTAATNLRCWKKETWGKLEHTIQWMTFFWHYFATKNSLKRPEIFQHEQRISTTTASIATMWSSTSAFLKLRFQWAARACGQGWGGFQRYRAHERNRQSHRAFFWTMAFNQI